LRLRSGGCEGIVNSPYSMGPPYERGAGSVPPLPPSQKLTNTLQAADVVLANTA
jgi:hypothetical protein